jgi:hypothetical protein
MFIVKLQVVKYSWGKVSLKHILSLMSGRDVTDSRDGVYSALSMAKNVDSNNWTVDYKQEPIETFLDATEEIVWDTGSLDIICHSNWSEQHDHGCSWVPRFAGGFGSCGCETFTTNSLTVSGILLANNGILHEILTDMPRYKASGTLKADAVFDRSSRKLTAKGVIAHKITKVLDATVGYRGGLIIPRQWKEVALAFKVATDGLSEEG